MSAAIPERTIWAFDLGKASLGEAVRVSSEFRHVASWLIPAEFARRGPATVAGTPANRYRALKTREAHRAREECLRRLFRAADVEVLAAKSSAGPADPRLTREFPARGDETCYTSCLLRIKLLRGDLLAGWQIHKALHSAIQRRGYDPDVPWKKRRNVPAAPDVKNEEEGVTAQRAGAYRDALTQMAPGKPEFHFPCYLDAARLGLWSPADPDVLRLRINHHTEPARNRGEDRAIVAPCDLVEAEVRRLLQQAAKQFPKLDGQADRILFGPGEVAYASHYPQLRSALGLRAGGADDWDGILGQKVPRFDNRIIAKCALIPGLNVCKAVVREDPAGRPYPDSLLVGEVTFLLKLKNIQIERATGGLSKLRAEEIRALFNDPKRKPTKLDFATKSQWEKVCLRLGVRSAPGYDLVAAPYGGGRSRFSRPALRILKQLILSGETPVQARARELAALNGNTDKHRGLIPDDLEFLKKMGATWDNLYVPDQQHDALLAVAERKGRDTAIRRLIGANNDPIVRHRLEIFWDRLVQLEKKFGPPGHVIIEFVREDFMGKKAKRSLALFQKKREEERKRARESTQNVDGRSASLKWELLEQQGFACVFTGDPLGQTSLDDLEIEHIVPRALGGPDAIINYVVTTKATNTTKAKRTPYAWFEANGFAGWDAYKRRVEALATKLRGKKVKLLTSPDAAELVQRYTALAETAWIAKLAQTLVALHFSWPIRSETGERHITVVNGGLTARVRRKYKLNSLLNPCPDGKDPREWEELCEKNRTDKRHHALDAMVISCIPSWARDPGKEGFFRLPDGVTPETFGASIHRVFARPLAYEKPALAETAYALRPDGSGSDIIAQRVPLRSLAYRNEAMKQVFSVAAARKQADGIRDPQIRQLVVGFIATDFDEGAWRTFCDTAHLTRSDGSPGPFIKKVSVYFAEPSEFANLSKDKTNPYSGVWRKRLGNHRGQYIYRDKTGGARVRPVYVFESPFQVREKLAKEGFIPLLFLQSNCLVATSKETTHAKLPLPAGTYQLNTVRADGYVQLTTQDGTTYVAKPKPGQRTIPFYPLEALLSAGLCRLE